MTTRTLPPTTRALVRGPAEDRVYAVVAAGAAALAAAIHALVVPEHLEEAWLVGAFFAALALAQAGLAVAVLRPLPVAVLVAALAAHVGVVALYVVSRTTDLWFLPAHGADHLPVANGVGDGVPDYPGSRMEPVGVLDLACLAAELVLVAMLTGLLPRRARSLATTALVVVAALGLLVRATGVLR